ncbi:MAG: Na+/H+ antiporter subunit E [bacterium]|nr:Na+/H+ antiporter subunit E [bacterium]
MKYAVTLGVVLFSVWLLWSGHYTPLLISFGAASCFSVVLLIRGMRSLDAESAPLHLLPRLVAYTPWLLWKIARANVVVARRILSPGLPISPCVVRVEATQTTDLGRAIHANSITLTPGTVSLFVEEREIVVHALSREAADDLLLGAIDRRATRVEGA